MACRSGVWRPKSRVRSTIGDFDVECRRRQRFHTLEMQILRILLAGSRCQKIERVIESG